MEQPEAKESELGVDSKAAPDHLQSSFDVLFFLET